LTYLSLPGKPVNLVETGTGDTTFEDAEVLFCVYIERLLVYLVIVWLGIVVWRRMYVVMEEEVIYGGVAVGWGGWTRRWVAGVVIKMVIVNIMVGRVWAGKGGGG